MMRVEYHYPKETVVLCKLCGYLIGELPIELNSIFQFAEAKWQENIDRIVRQKSKVQYLFIGEAPPATRDNNANIRYFYGTNEGEDCDPINRSFLSESEMKKPVEERLEILANRGFLMIDTMPFAVNFSFASRRNRIAYRILVQQCIQSYMLPHIYNPRIPWADTVKLAFGVKITYAKVAHI